MSWWHRFNKIEAADCIRWYHNIYHIVTEKENIEKDLARVDDVAIIASFVIVVLSSKAFLYIINFGIKFLLLLDTVLTLASMISSKHE